MRKTVNVIVWYCMFLSELLGAALAAADQIGALFSVTGPASFLGEPEKNTLEMLVKEINAKGGIKGATDRSWWSTTPG